MRFMMIVKSSPETEAGQMPSDAELAKVAKYNEELVQAGVMLDGTGLQPSSKGWTVKVDAAGKRSVVDGPFAEAKEPLRISSFVSMPGRAGSAGGGVLPPAVVPPVLPPARDARADFIRSSSASRALRSILRTPGDAGAFEPVVGDELPDVVAEPLGADSITVSRPRRFHAITKITAPMTMIVMIAVRL